MVIADVTSLVDTEHGLISPRIFIEKEIYEQTQATLQEIVEIRNILWT